MHATKDVPSRRHTAGATRLAILILVVLLAAGAGLITWTITRGNADDAVPQMAIATQGTVQRDGGAASTQAWMQRARAAVSQQHLIAPAGDNAIEWYLRVLQQEPGNRTAQDALREIFPFAASTAEQAIGQGDPAEAQRQIDLLARADPSNYTPTLLRSKLQAQLQLAAAPPPRETPQAPTAPVRSHATASTPVPTPQAPIERPPARVEPMAPSPQASAAPTPATIDTPPVLVRRFDPYYPADARRTRRTGWVDLRVLVAADGSVSRASVIDAEPKNLFDRAALSAVERWQYTPGTRAGVPAPSEVRQRITFNL